MEGHEHSFVRYEFCCFDGAASSVRTLGDRWTGTDISPYLHPLLQILFTNYSPTVYHGHVLLPLLLGNVRLIWSVAHVNASWKCPNALEYTSLSDSTPQRHAATIPGITLSHLIFVAQKEIFCCSIL